MTISLTTRRFLKTGAALVVALTLAACGKKEEAAPAAAASAADAPPARVYVVGTDAAYAPFESQNEKGEIVGFDIDVVSAVAQKAGIQVKFVNTPWEGMFNTVAQGDRDLLVSAITITDERKQTMDFSAPYFDAHDGLWTMTWKTREDFVARMALVPRTLEARGLDATPLIQAKLRRAGDLAAVEILDVILREEVGHVAIGNHWYRWACEREGLDPVSHYRELVRQYAPPRLRPPFNRQARLDAGFSETELAWLEAGSPTTDAPAP